MPSLPERFTASPSRAYAAAVLLAFLALLLPFGSWLPGALVVLLALRHSLPVPDWTVAAIAGTTIAVWLFAITGLGFAPSFLVSAALVAPPFLIGRVMARAGSLNLAFQLATLAALGLLVVVHVVLADPPGFWRPVLERFAAELDRAGIVLSNVGSGRRPQDSEFIESSAAQMWGVVAWLLLFNTMVAAFVGLFWDGTLERAARLGPAFRSLKAGRTLAALAVVTTVLTIAFRWSLPVDAMWVFLGAFVLQSLAVVHAARASIGFSVGWLAAVYMLLFVAPVVLPRTAVFVQGGLAVFGFIDNWFPFRARFTARAQGRSG